MTTNKKQIGWMNKTEAAASAGISTQAFDKWGVQPVGRVGREVFFDVRSIIENRIQHQNVKQQPAGAESSSSVDESELLAERVRLMRAQADSMELKNEIQQREVVECTFATFVLSKVISALASKLDTVPLSMRRKFPDLENRHIEHLTRDLVQARNTAAQLDELIPELLDEYLASTD